MSDDKRFVNLTKGSGGSSWADEDDTANAPAEPKAAKTWGNVAPVKAVSIAEQLDEAKNQAPKEQPAPRRDGPREPRGDRDYGNRGGDRDYGNRSGGGDREYGNRSGGGDRDYGNRGGGSRDYGSREPRSEQREPRPKNPMPDQPPYVAFIGNLAYSVNEDVIMEFFGELGVDQIRMVNDPETGKPKGFAYVHFQERSGLENALTCDGMDFYGRRLNVDVAASKPREERGQWGPGPGGARRGFGERGFGDRGGDRGGDRYGGGGDRDFNRGPPAERKPLNLAPRTKPLDSAPAAEDASAAPKSGGADPFGGATADRAKMDKIAEERLKREQEREAKRKEEIRGADERRQKEREERDRARETAPRGRGSGPRGGGEPRAEREAPPKSEKESEIDSRNTWRSDRKAGEDRPARGGGFSGGRGGGRGGAAAGGAGAGRAPEKKWVEDSDGFKTKKEDAKPAAAAPAGGGGSWAAVAAKATPAAGEEKNAANPYDALGEDQ